MSKMRLISKDELLSTMKGGRVILPHSSDNMLRNKIITDLIEVVETFPEADTSNYEHMVQERNYYMDMCSSYEKTLVKLCKTIVLMGDGKGEEDEFV